MAENSFQEKSEKATPKRRKDARDKGQVAKSNEISSVLVLLACLGTFYFSGSWMYLEIEKLTYFIFQGIGSFQLASISSNNNLLIIIYKNTINLLLPLFMAVIVFGVLGNLAQIGFIASGKMITPDFKKLNPISGLKKLFSIRSLSELIKSVIKIMIIGIVAYLTLKNEMVNMPMLVGMDVHEVFKFLCKTALKICLITCIVLVFLAIMDFAFQKYQHEKELKMTLQEVKEESKQTEGDPKIKQRIRSAQMEMIKRRMIHAVPTATVVITNPTHLAVAIKFEMGKMPAPLVVAKGAGEIAAQIKKIAKDHNVPIVENKPLARIMFKSVKVGDLIPVELYQAVAEIIAYIYKLKGKM